MLEKLFRLKDNKTNVKTEIMAGITTFMTMAYILAVNPNVLSSTGMDSTAVLLATCLASFIGTACMAFMANLPFALSAGMGLNAFMAYTVCGIYGYPWQAALLAVFIEGVIFIILSLTKVREAIFNFITRIFSDHTVVTVESGTAERSSRLLKSLKSITELSCKHNRLTQSPCVIKQHMALFSYLD